jgi:aspartate carbamoyltransferase regulatory subunit
VRQLKIEPIRNGTVIDHISAGNAMKVLRILGVPSHGWRSIVSIAMNVPTAKGPGQKDIIKIEDRELDPHDIDKIALVAPEATVNIIRNFEVAEKAKVALADEVVGLLKCENANCISNHKEPVKPRFRVASRAPPRLRCVYCDREVEDVARAIIV